MPQTTTRSVAEVEKEIAEYKAQIQRRRETAHERGDEPHLGLSAWAEECNLRELELELEVAKKGGMWEFPALMKDGVVVNAKRREGQYGMYWMLLDEAGKPTGEFFGDSRGPRSKLSKAGYTVGKVLKPARVIMAGSGTGLAGAMSVRPIVIEAE